MIKQFLLGLSLASILIVTAHASNFGDDPILSPYVAANKGEPIDHLTAILTSHGNIYHLQSKALGYLRIEMIRIEEANISIVRSGQFDPLLPNVVFIHNNSACKEVFINLFEHLKGRCNFVALDLPGHGQSSDAAKPRQTYSFQGYAACVIKVMDALGIDKSVPVGWSLGGHVALEMMHMYPDRLKGVITTGSPAMPKGLWGQFQAFNVFRMLWKGVLPMIGQSKKFTEEEAKFFMEAGGIHQPDAFFLRATMRTHGEARAIMHENVNKGVGMCDEQALLATSNIPVGIVIGKNDSGVNADYVRSQDYKNATILELDTDHGTVWNMPDVFAEFLLLFTYNCK